MPQPKFKWTTREEEEKKEQVKIDKAKMPSLEKQVEAQAEALQELIELMMGG